MKQDKCFITGKLVNMNKLVSANSIRKNLTEYIRKEFPDFNEDSHISMEALRDYRKKYLENIIESEIGELDKVEHEVLNAIEKHELVSENIDESQDEKTTFGQRLADKVATFGGSWFFIMLFGFIICVWIILNSLFLINKVFDPYPYILLNLILSCLAALQAPVIMMSQNRKEEKDRMRSENDYLINLKAELEIRSLHEKIDLLLQEEIKTLYTSQSKQLVILEELKRKIDTLKI